MNQCDDILIYHKGLIHVIDKEPYETIGDVYKRGWFIINNKGNETNIQKLVSDSIIEINKNKGMDYY
jgi:hypothetical protein